MRRETRDEAKQIRERTNRPSDIIRVTQGEDCKKILPPLFFCLFFHWAELCFLSFECMALYTYPSPLGKISGLLCCGCRIPSF